MNRLPSLAPAIGATGAGSSIHVVALFKGGERYVLMFDDERRAEALRTIGRWASNPELSFNWYDAAALSSKISNEAGKP